MVKESPRPSTLVPDASRHPYYIYAPAYVQHSAGVRVLHFLCHWLNRMGERAFIFNLQPGGRLTNPDLLTPLVTQEVASHHAMQGLSPIVIYPETEWGNPLEALCVVRYVLNVPGHLGGDVQYSPNELVWAYSEQLSALCSHCDGVLHMPVIDQNVFRRPETTERKGAVFYAAKYQGDHGQKIFGLPDGAVEITRGLPDSQTPTEIARLMQKAEVFYCFENTALATEAVLCGCPAVFMPNAYLEKPIALNELGWDGFAWGDAPEEVARARATVALGEANYARTVSAFFKQLEDFVEKTQQRVVDNKAADQIGSLSEIMATDVLQKMASIDRFDSREIANTIRNRRKWRFHEWFRLVRALNKVAFQSVLARIFRSSGG